MRKLEEIKADLENAEGLVKESRKGEENSLKQKQEADEAYRLASTILARDLERVNALRNELAVDSDLSLGKNVWQKETMALLKRHPGVEFHFSQNLIKNLNSISTPIMNKKGTAPLEAGKARAAMLSFLAELVEHSKVTKCKDGNYKWTDMPKGWVSPKPISSTETIIQRPN